MKHNPVIFFISAVVLGYACGVLLLQMNQSGLDFDIKVTLSPLDGHAWWRAFQNRLIAGWIVKIFSFKSLVIVGMILVNLLWMWRGYFGIVLVDLVIVLLQDGHWLYGWDIVGLVIFSALILMIAKNVNTWWLVPLFLVGLLNRETSLVIPLWLLFDAMFKRDHKQFVVSLGLIVFGMMMIEVLRSALFQGSDPAHPYGNHFYLIENLSSFFFRPAPHWGVDMIPAFMIGWIGFLGLQWKRLSVNRRISLLCASVLTVSIVFLAYVHELRVWLDVVPFLIYSSLND